MLFCIFGGACSSLRFIFGFIFFSFLQRAFESLCSSTHLYGRRLVLEWAEDEDSVDALRKRTAEHFHGSILFWGSRNHYSFNRSEKVWIFTKKKCYILQYDVEGLNFNLASNSAKKKKDLLDDLFGKEIQEWSEYKDQRSIKKETFIRQKGKQNDNNSSKTVIAWQAFSQPGQRMSRINENDYKTFDFGEFCTKWYWLWHMLQLSHSKASIADFKS